MTAIIAKLIGSIIRHGLTALGGYLVSKGIIDNADVVQQLIAPSTEIIVGIVTFLLGLGASLFKDQIKDQITGIFTSKAKS